jgi:hypothetical protein
MKFTAIWGMLFIIASGYAYGQPCPGNTITLNSSTVPGGVLATGTTTAEVIFVGSGTSGFITTSPGSTTNLVATAPSSFLSSAKIVFSTNFQTNIGESGFFSANIAECGKIDVSVPGGSPARLSPATPPLLVYPTVSTGAINITGSATDLSNANILVFDETGRTVFSLHNEANTTLYLDLGNLANGLYFMQIRQATKTTTQKIIINK